MNSKKEMYELNYQYLVNKFPKRPWLKAINKLGVNAKINKLYDYYISYGLWLYDCKGLEQLDEYESYAVSEALFYSSKLIEFYESLDTTKKNAFYKRWEAAFSGPNDMRAITFELFVFYTLINYGWNVICKDDQFSGDTYDYLISKQNTSIQVECKSFAYDKGLIISADDAQKLLTMINNSLKIKHQSPTNELIVVTVDILKKIPDNSTELSNLISNICSAIEKNDGSQNPEFKVRTKTFSDVININEDINELPSPPTQGINLGCLLSEANGNSSRVCLELETRASNPFWREFEKVCRDAAKRQLKKNKPSILAIHFSNVESLDLITKDPRFISKKDQIFDQQHLIKMVLISNTHVYEDTDFPYTYLQPILKEFSNIKTIYPNIENLFIQ
ncbi:hypothetical protein [Citrobacter youngae]|uniref:hypothetical protein n=1 Tax=Citrobacter youngae TaxID=133448 RepID=UPI003EE21AAA